MRTERGGFPPRLILLCLPRIRGGNDESCPAGSTAGPGNMGQMALPSEGGSAGSHPFRPAPGAPEAPVPRGMGDSSTEELECGHSGLHLPFITDCGLPGQALRSLQTRAPSFRKSALGLEPREPLGTLPAPFPPSFRGSFMHLIFTELGV